jgi:uncharacterized membrane protein
MLDSKYRHQGGQTVYYFLLTLVLCWSVYAEIVHKLSQYHLVVIILIALIVELLIALNRKFDNAEINMRMRRGGK